MRIRWRWRIAIVVLLVVVLGNVFHAPKATSSRCATGTERIAGTCVVRGYHDLDVGLRRGYHQPTRLMVCDRLTGRCRSEPHR